MTLRCPRDAGARPQRQVREEVRGAAAEGVPHAADPVRSHRAQAERPHGINVVRGTNTRKLGSSQIHNHNSCLE